MKKSSCSNDIPKAPARGVSVEVRESFEQLRPTFVLYARGSSSTLSHISKLLVNSCTLEGLTLGCLRFEGLTLELVALCFEGMDARLEGIDARTSLEGLALVLRELTLGLLLRDLRSF